MNLSLSTLSKQASDHLLEDLLSPCAPHNETGTLRGKKGPVFSHGGPGDPWRSLRVLAGDELSLRAEEGPFPLVRFLRSLKSRGKVSTLGRVSGKVRLRANICGLFCQGL